MNPRHPDFAHRIALNKQRNQEVEQRARANGILRRELNAELAAENGGNGDWEEQQVQAGMMGFGQFNPHLTNLGCKPRAMLQCSMNKTRIQTRPDFIHPSGINLLAFGIHTKTRISVLRHTRPLQGIKTLQSTRTLLDTRQLQDIRIFQTSTRIHRKALFRQQSITFSSLHQAPLLSPRTRSTLRVFH